MWKVVCGYDVFCGGWANRPRCKEKRNVARIGL